MAQLEGREPVELLGGAVYLALLRNPGAAFSLATGYTWVLTLVAIVVVGRDHPDGAAARSTGWAIALGLVLGGALGNLIDRDLPRARPAAGPRRGHGVAVRAGRQRLAGVQRGRRRASSAAESCWCCSRCSAASWTAPVSRRPKTQEPAGD